MNGKKEEENEAKLCKWNFGNCGPVHLTYVDWKSPDHMRSVYASLVQGVYILERDRQQKRTGSKALAPPWWTFFHFQCIKILVDQFDYSIFGAVFEHKPQASYYNHNQGVPSRHIIVFRGTIIEPQTRQRDLKLDLQLPLNGLTQDSRYQMAFHEIHNTLINRGPRNVVLVGHSLGAAIALKAGKDLAKQGYHIESYLYNPPCTSSPPIEKIGDHNLRGKVRIAKTIVTTGLYHVKNGIRHNHDMTRQHDQFLSLCCWVPNLFVNPRDPVCCEYAGHFEHRERMKEMGLYKVDSIETKRSLTSMLAGNYEREIEQSRSIPSALLTKNMIPVEQSLKQAHCIEQWWQPHSYFHSKLYMYRE